jgi:hypothetical protein
MVRQCAWCLCLIDCTGERLSSSPLPKLYEASHGICSVCGTMWIARATENSTGQGPASQPEHKEARLVSQPEYKEQSRSKKTTASTTGTLPVLEL